MGKKSFNAIVDGLINKSLTADQAVASIKQMGVQSAPASGDDFAYAPDGNSYNDSQSGITKLAVAFDQRKISDDDYAAVIDAING